MNVGQKLISMDQELIQVKSNDLDSVKDHFGLFEQLKRELLVENVDYGKIPYTDNKCLFKPGAEKLIKVFNIYVNEIEETERTIDVKTGYVNFEYKIELVGPNGLGVGKGVGSCNSFEDKYYYTGWRKKETPTRPKEEMKAEGLGRNKKVGKVWQWQERTKKRPQEMVALTNTIQKMAKKRAFVDACLMATGGSSFFTQDLDSMPHVKSQVIGDAKALQSEIEDLNNQIHLLTSGYKKVLDFALNKVGSRDEVLLLAKIAKQTHTDSVIVSKFKTKEQEYPKNG